MALSGLVVKLTGFSGTLSTNRLVLYGQVDYNVDWFYWDTAVK